jgi:hypothetical protein
MSNGKCGLLQHVNIRDNLSGVWGFALVKRGFSAPLHRHPVAEDYYYLFGTGNMHLDGKVLSCTAPSKVHVPSDVVHAMTPTSNYVLLLYHLHSGPFHTVPYSYIKSRLGHVRTMKNFIPTTVLRRKKVRAKNPAVIATGQIETWLLALIILAIIVSVFVGPRLAFGHIVGDFVDFKETVRRVFPVWSEAFSVWYDGGVDA